MRYLQVTSVSLRKTNDWVDMYGQISGAWCHVRRARKTAPYSKGPFPQVQYSTQNDMDFLHAHVEDILNKDRMLDQGPVRDQEQHTNKK